MLPILKTKSTLIKSFEYIPDKCTQVPDKDHTLSSGLDWKKYHQGSLSTVICCRPLFYYLAPHLVTFNNSTSDSLLFLLLVEAPTIVYTQKAVIYFPRFCDGAQLTDPEKERGKIIAYKMATSFPKLEYLQSLLLHNCDTNEFRLFLMKQISKLRRLQAVSWPPVHFSRNHKDDLFPNLPDETNDLANEDEASKLLLTSLHKQYENPQKSSVIYFALTPLVKIDIGFPKTFEVFELLIETTARTLRILHINSSSAVSGSGLEPKVLKTIGDLCPRLEELSLYRLIVENEDSLFPFTNLCNLKKLSLSYVIGLTNGYRLGYSTGTTLQDPAMMERLDQRTPEEIEGAKRGFRFIQSCAGSLEELNILFDTLRDATPIHSLFGYDDDNTSKNNICVYPLLSKLDISSGDYDGEAKECFSFLTSEFAPNLRYLRTKSSSKLAGSGKTMNENILMSTIGSYRHLETLSFSHDNWVVEDEDSPGASILKLFVKPQQISKEEEQEEATSSSSCIFPDTLKQVTFGDFSINGKSKKIGFSEKSIELLFNSLQQQQISSCYYYFTARNLKKITIETKFSTSFLKLLGESAQHGFLPKVEELYIRTSRVTSYSAANEPTNQITDESIFHLRHFGKTLTSLEVTGLQKITGSGAGDLVRHLPCLLYISFSCCSNIDDDFLEALQDHVYLRTLDLEKTTITGTGFKYFTKLKSLDCVMMMDCHDFTDFELLAPLNQCMGACGYIDIVDCGFFLEQRHGLTCTEVMDEICDRILVDLAKSGTYISG